MKKLVYIDSCIRDENSRTKKIASALIEELKKKYEISTFTLNDLNLEIVKKDVLNKRLNNNIPDYVLKWANTIKNADRVVIAAPFWDMSIPSALKVFIELCSIINITFNSNNETCYGNCKSEKLLYITTRGMNISTKDPLDQGTSYLEALSTLWGLGEVKVVACKNMDYVSPKVVEEKINQAIIEGLKICKDF